MAIMDLVVGYPDQKTVFIGLLMVDKACQRKGIGSAILAEDSQALAALGFERLHLGWIEGNQEAGAFWQHNQFQVKGETTNGAGLPTVTAVRSLLHQEKS